MPDAVLDASALLALLQDEPGSERVLATLPGALISAVNLSEVVAKLAEVGMPAATIQRSLRLSIEVVPFDDELAVRTGLLRPVTRSAGLSLGDRACLALAASRSLPALTTDRAWNSVATGVDVVVIR
jgi:PIN domain nuclease of toxin-antitoxin system